MAQNAPNCKDTQEIQFKLHDKFVAFRNCGEPRSNVKLLAVSSSRGLLFAGNPQAPELKVLIVKDVATAKTSGKEPLARQVQLPSIPNYMSCSADGNLLAINYTQQTGTSLLFIYAVQSFMTPEVRVLYNIRLAPEDYVHAVQLLWNPVLPNSLAIVLSNGGLAMYVLKDGGNFELHTLDKSQQVKCGCWSPKGKQIVLGFPGGRLQQFKPDLTPAKTLACPPNVHDAPFDTIAVHWLSTFQFAVIFLQHGEDCSPALYIINAPKAGTPTYTNYYDICFSLNGPRNHQFHFTHVPQWNLLLLCSANGVEVGVLGTSEAGDTPTWQQLTLLDEARIELPLSDATQDETFPMGFVYDTSSLHQLVINEQHIPSMPMVHVLGTDGTLLAFNFLNLQPGVASVCSPPPPLADTSGQFCALSALLGPEEQPVAAAAAVAPTPAAAAEVNTPALQDISFAFTPNTVTSTPAPAKDKPPSLFSGFGNVVSNAASPFAAPSASLNFAAAPQPMAAPSFTGFGTSATPATGPPPASVFGGHFSNLAMDKPTNVVNISTAAQQPANATVAPTKKPNNNMPLYTVPPTFAPVAAAATKPPSSSAAGKSSDYSAREVDDVIAEIMNVQIGTFSDQIEQQKQQTKALLSQIEAPNTIRFYAKRLDDLQELNDQANDIDFEQDVQVLRHALGEAYTMMAECRAKLEVYRKPDITRLMTATSFDAAGRRVLSRLQSYLAANEAQLQLAQQHIDTQWEQYQDVVRRSSKSKMHMPCLEVIYQRLTRLQNLASDQRIKHNNIKSRLKERGLLQSALLNQENSRARNNEAVDTLADSILSMSLNQAVDTNRAKLSQQKLQSIRALLQHHKIHIISPQRPDRVGLKSEVILETKLKAELKKKTAATAAAAAAAAASAKPVMAHKATQAAAAPAQLAKPTASKPAVSAAAAEKPFSVPASIAVAPAAPASAAPFSFSQSSPFVKTTATTATTTTLSAGETAKPTASMFGGTSPFSFGQMGAPKQGLSIGGPFASATTAPNLFAGFGGAPIDATKPKPTQEQPKEPTVKSMESKKELPPPEPAPEPVKSTTAPQASTTAKVDSTVKPFSFAGFGSHAGTAIGSSSSSFNFGGFGSSLGSSAAPSVATAATAAVTSSVDTVVSSSSSLPTATVAAAPTAVSAPSIISSSAAPPEPPIDNLFGSINICKPQAKDSAADAAPSNIFSGFGQSTGNAVGGFQLGAGGDGPKDLFGSSVSVSAADSSSSSTTASSAIMTAATPATTAAIAARTAATTAATATTTPATAATTPATAATTPAIAATTPATVATTPATTTTTAAAPVNTVGAAAMAATTSAGAAPGSSFSFSNAFSSLNTSSSVGSVAATSSVTSTSGSIFGGGNTFAPAATTSSPFQAAGTAAPPTGNIFGSVPKPEASVFGTAPSGLFAAAAATSIPSPFASSPAAAPAATSISSPFGSSPAAATAATASSGGNIFGQAAANITTAVKPSGFGAPSPGAVGGSIFGGGGGGGAPASPFGSTSIFGGGNNSAQSSPAAAPTGSIFGQNAFGSSATSSGGNLFGNVAATQPQASAFGGGSIFAAAAANTTSPAASGGSIFGGGSSGGFGSFAQTTPAPGGFGSGFAQSSGASVAQSGFGSPQQQTAQSPAGGFGAKPVFGGNPAFGGSPTFGGAPTFGSPKGFNAFGGSPGIVAPPSFGAPPKAPDGNIFETLGGTDTGLSFGNLAQTNNPNAQKSTFGGSSFMTYR